MMNLDEVKAMSNKDLRTKAAGLVGFTDIRPRFVPVPWLMDLVEEELSGYLDGEIRCIPDYPNDIAAAWELWKRLGDLYEYVGICSANGCMCSAHTVELDLTSNGVEASGDLGGDPNPPNKEARAITRVYILAKTQEEEK